MAIWGTISNYYLAIRDFNTCNYPNIEKILGLFCFDISFLFFGFKFYLRIYRVISYMTVKEGKNSF